MPQVSALCTPEDEAKTRWCPQTPRTYAQDGGLSPHCLCIASGCNVWITEEGEDPPAGWCGLINPSAYVEPAPPVDPPATQSAQRRTSRTHAKSDDD